MDTCSKCKNEIRVNNHSWGKNCIKELNKKNYTKRRNDPIKWAKILKIERDRFKKFGHKKVRSKCIVCGKVWMGVMKERQFCSQKCVSGGIYNGRWNGGKHTNSTGYVMIFSPYHPNRIAGKYMLEHRLIMEEKIGRFLSDDEVVHHINGIKDDNRIENLELTSNSEHSKNHWKEWKEKGGSPVEIRIKNRLKRTEKT